MSTPTTTASRLAALTRPGQEFPRKFVPANLNAGEWKQIEPLFSLLENRTLSNTDQIEQWLLDWSELQSVISEEGARRYISMTCATEDTELEKSYLQFIEEIEPKIKPVNDLLTRKLLESPYVANLPERYAVFLRSCKNSVDLFREENVQIETELDVLSQQYQKIIGAQTVSHDGNEFTLQQMQMKLEERDRSVRQAAWEAVWNRRMQDKSAVEDIFDRMLVLRSAIARNAGLSDYRSYIFRRYERFDYSPKECYDFHDAVERVVVPLYAELLEERRKSLGVETLRPWDLDCDRAGREPLRPYSAAEQLVSGCLDMFGRVDQELGGYFDRMMKLGLLDLDSRKGKAPGGYQHDLAESRLPFIFMNAAGSNDDLFTLLHEGGHAFHLFQSRHEPLYAYRGAPIEYCEVASMGMEQLASDHLSVFYSEAEAARVQYDKFEAIISFLPWCATVDAFQHWIYTHPGHTRGERTAMWVNLRKRFLPIIDWTGYEEMNSYRWIEKLHIFQYPFYYIEYGIAQLGALQLWLNSRKDYKRAVQDYKRGLSVGGSKPLPQLFAEMGLVFDFSAEMLQPIIESVTAEMKALLDKETLR